jgi:hypothetical protein
MLDEGGGSVFFSFPPPFEADLPPGKLKNGCFVTAYRPPAAE